jgi:hypothetical protein
MKAEVPKELLVALARGDGIAFVGSGPSKAAGFPDLARPNPVDDGLVRQSKHRPSKQIRHRTAYQIEQALALR